MDSKKRCRFSSMILITAMLFSMSSCKKTAPLTDESGNVADPSGGGAAALQSDYVLGSTPYFSCETMDALIPTDPNREVDVITYGDLFSEDTYLAVTYGLLYEIPEDQLQARDEEMYDLDPRNPEDLQRMYELQAMFNDYAEGGIAFFKYDGTFVAKGLLDIDSEERVRAMTSSEDGQLVTLLESFSKADQKYSYKIVIFGLDGTRQKKISIQTTKDIYAGSITCLRNGTYALAENWTLIIVDSEGKIVKENPLVNQCYGLLYRDGKCYVHYYDVKYTETGSTVHDCLQEIDPDTGDLKPVIDYDHQLGYLRQPLKSGEIFYDLGNSEGIRRNDPDGTTEMVMTWNDTDSLPIYESERTFVLTLSEEEFYIADMNMDDDGEESLRISHFQKEKTNPYAGRRIIRVGINGIYNSYRRRIIEYNTSPESKSRVVLEPTGLTFRGSYYDKVLGDSADQVLLAMRSGTGPDILLNFSEFGQFDTDELLVDLNTYIDGENGIDRNRYYDNILRAFEVDGKLYQLPMTLELDLLVGNPDLLGDVSGWTCEEFEEKIDFLSGKASPFLNFSYDSMEVLMALLSHDMNTFVDYSSGMVNFDSDAFRRILQIAGKCKTTVSDDQLTALFDEYDSWTHHSQADMIMQDGLSAMVPIRVTCLAELARYTDLCRGNRLFIGWPTTNGSGISAKAEMSVAISAFSEVKDEAWDFVRFLLSPEVQTQNLRENSMRGISICRESEDASMQMDMEKYEEDLKKYGGDLDMIGHAPLSDLDVLLLNTLIEQVTTPVLMNPTIMNIVWEEASAYFAGDKSTEEVSRSIQNRASTIMKEISS
ncbi:MAG: extracellular solute-binding protein [Clostridiales bacterium]|nr:extracellular solute-binding protein [Clostridiales bacterium]